MRSDLTPEDVREFVETIKAEPDVVKCDLFALSYLDNMYAQGHFAGYNTCLRMVTPVPAPPRYPNRQHETRESLRD